MGERDINEFENLLEQKLDFFVQSYKTSGNDREKGATDSWFYEFARSLLGKKAEKYIKMYDEKKNAR